jgi:hypothetical protein
MKNQNSIKEILTPNNFSKIADVIYSEFISYSEYKNKKIPEHIVIFKTKDYLFYKLINFEIKQNQTIFCNNLVLKDLFEHLSGFDQSLNLNLITHQTDELITRDFYIQKPQSINKWYSVNVEYECSDLVPLPLGLAQDFQDQYLTKDRISEVSKISKNTLEPNLYINFKISTNYKEREILYKQFLNKDWAKIDSPNLSLTDYLNNINNASFILAPWGNGVDSHRFWEALYLGKVPITKHHHTYKTAKDLPVLFVNDYSEISEEILKNFIENFKDSYSWEVLSIQYWHDLIKKDYEDSEITYVIKESLFNAYVNKFIFRSLMSLRSKNKILKFYLKQFKKIPRKIAGIIKQ